MIRVNGPAFYNEIDPYAAGWLRNLIREGLIPDGEVCARSIVDLRPSDLDGFGACHFFAGLGGWPLALRLAGVPDDFPVWTGSCPCQPFSVAGKRGGFDDARHLWPEFRRLIAERRPPVVFGEQVASAAAWLAGVRGDLEALEYAVGAMPIEAASVGAPHKRDRYWFVADATNGRRGEERQVGRGLDERDRAEGRAARRDAGGSSEPVADADQPGPQGRPVHAERAGQWAPWTDGVEWLTGADGKARRVEPGVRLLAHGVPNRVAKLHALGNAIVPQVAATFIRASLDAIENVRAAA